jgi:hypothetical protein
MAQRWVLLKPAGPTHYAESERRRGACPLSLSLSLSLRDLGGGGAQARLMAEQGSVSLSRWVSKRPISISLYLPNSLVDLGADFPREEELRRVRHGD